MDWARSHHDKLDHPPCKPSTEPDQHRSFTLDLSGQVLEMSASAMFVRIADKEKLLYVEKYSPSGAKERR
jgi:hypothetical protein